MSPTLEMSKIRYIACAGLIMSSYLTGYLPVLMYIIDDNVPMCEEEQIKLLGYRPRILEKLMKFIPR